MVAKTRHLGSAMHYKIVIILTSFSAVFAMSQQQLQQLQQQTACGPAEVDSYCGTVSPLRSTAVGTGPDRACYVFNDGDPNAYSYPIIFSSCAQPKADYSSRSLEYGRIASFKTPDAYISVLQFLQNVTANDTIIGAISINNSETLTGYKWATVSGNTRYLSSITSNNNIVVQSKTKSSELALAVDPSGQFQFSSYDSYSLASFSFLCEYGCGSIGRDDTNIDWDNSKSPTTTVSTAATDTTTSFIPSPSATFSSSFSPAFSDTASTSTSPLAKPAYIVSSTSAVTTSKSTQASSTVSSLATSPMTSPLSPIFPSTTTTVGAAVTPRALASLVAVQSTNSFHFVAMTSANEAAITTKTLSTSTASSTLTSSSTTPTSSGMSTTTKVTDSLSTITNPAIRYLLPAASSSRATDATEPVSTTAFAFQTPNSLLVSIVSSTSSKLPTPVPTTTTTPSRSLTDKVTVITTAQVKAYGNTLSQSTKTSATSVSAASVSPTIKLCNRCFPDLMSPKERLATQIMHSLGCAWLLGCLVICMVLGIITDFRDLNRQLPGSQEVSLLVCHLVIFLWHDATHDEMKCNAASVLIQFSTVVYYSFLLLESVRSFSIITGFVSAPEEESIAAWQLIGWVLPLMFVIATAVPYFDEYDADYSCWLNLGHDIMYYTIVPVIMLSIVTLIMTEATGIHARKSYFVPSNQMKPTYNSALISRHGMWIILPLSVASWATGYSAVYYQRVGAYAVVFALNVSLGVAICFFHAGQNIRIRALLHRVYTNMKMRRG